MVKRFKHLHVPDHWQQYWSRYPEGYTILEALINWVSQVDDMVDNVNDWNEYLEEFVNTFDKRLEPTVRKILKEMAEDGTLADLINEEIFADHTENFNSRGVNIKLAGADPGGEVDNTDIIQGLLNQGLDIFVPEGIFATKQLTFTKDNQLIQGTGTLKLWDSQYTPIVYARDKKNVRVKDISLDGNFKGNPLDNGKYEHMGELVSSQNTACVLFEYCKDSVIDSVHIKDAHSTPAVLHMCEHSTITRCYSLNHQREGFGLSGGKSCEISHCHSYHDPECCETLPWSLLFTAGVKGDGGNHKHKILDNVCVNSQAAYMTINTEMTEVKRNTVRKTDGVEVVNGPAIRLGHADKEDGDTSRRAYNCVVSENLIVGVHTLQPYFGNSRGISCDNAHGSVLQNNTIIGCHTGIGVSVSSGQNIIILDNTIKDTEHVAIDLFNVSGSKAINNFIDGGTIGIKVRGERVSLERNFIQNYKTNGIEVKHGGAFTLDYIDVIENHVKGDATTNYVIDNKHSKNNLYIANYGFTDSDDLAVINVSKKPTDPIYKTGTVALNRNPKQGEPFGWFCIDGPSMNWKEIGTHLVKQHGRYTMSGDGVTTEVRIPHGLQKVPAVFNAIPTSGGAGQAEISWLTAYTNEIHIRLRKPLPAGTDNVSFDWYVEG